MSKHEPITHIEWKPTEGNAGPVTYYGYWEGVKCFSIFWGMREKDQVTHTPYVIKSCLPGFRPDLPLQRSVADAQVMAERMLQRWAAKRKLLFKNHIVITDAMAAAGQAVVKGLSAEQVKEIVTAALAARG